MGNRKSAADASGQRQQGLDIHRIAGLHLAAQGASIVVQGYTYDHLIAVVAAVFGVSSSVDSFAAGAFKIEGRGVEQRQVQASEQVAMLLEQFLFYRSLVQRGAKGVASCCWGSALPSQAIAL